MSELFFYIPMLVMLVVLVVALNIVVIEALFDDFLDISGKFVSAIFIVCFDMVIIYQSVTLLN